MKLTRRLVAAGKIGEAEALTDFQKRAPDYYDMLLRDVARDAFDDVIPRFHTIHGAPVSPAIFAFTGTVGNAGEAIQLAPGGRQFLIDHGKLVYLIVRVGMVLITRRGAGEKLAGLWEFPGGKLEEGETMQACLARELKEELGIETSVGDVLAESEYHYDHGSIRLVAMKTTVVAGELCLTVHDRFEWVRPEDLESYPLAPADIPIAQRLRAVLL